MLLAAVVWYVDPRSLGRQLASANLGLLAAATVVYTIGATCAAVRWRFIARSLGLAAPLGAVVVMFFRAFTVNLLLPGATLSGDLLRSYQLAARGNPFLRAALSVVLDRLSGLWMLCVLSLVALLGAGAAGMLGAMSREAFAAYAAVLALAVALPWVPLPFHRALEEKRRQAMASGGAFFGAAGLSIAVQLVYSISLLLCTLAAGIGLSFPLVLAAAAPIFIMGAVPLGWAGFGTRELAAVVVLGLLGVPADQATAAALLYGLTQLAQGVLAAPLFLAKL
ncbi:MAG: lysylphosphatidylglycerol synthase transmembrane domain-containing protein [Betaproteobacteria bacterium]